MNIIDTIYNTLSLLLNNIWLQLPYLMIVFVFLGMSIVATLIAGQRLNKLKESELKIQELYKLACSCGLKDKATDILQSHQKKSQTKIKQDIH